MYVRGGVGVLVSTLSGCLVPTPDLILGSRTQIPLIEEYKFLTKSDLNKTPILIMFTLPVPWDLN